MASTALALVPANDDPPGLDAAQDDTAARRSVEKCREDFETYATVKADEIEEQRTAWRYYHGQILTDDQIEALEARGQPPIIFPLIAKKVDGLVGTIMRLRGDPKAYPRGPSHDQDAELATQCVRSVMDGSLFPTAVETDVVRDAAVHGFGVEEIYAEQGTEADPDICARRIDPTTFYYDPRSVATDFSDARYMGVSKWSTPDEIGEKWPGMEDAVSEDMGDFQTAFDTDRELLWQRAPNRVRLVEHWYKARGEWRVKYFTGSVELDDRRSPFVDDRGRTVPRFNAFAYGIDPDGVHYGMVRIFKGAQDAITQHRTKAVHIMNTRQLHAVKGALGPDIERQRKEAARPDGVLEIEGSLDMVRVEKADTEFLQQTKYYEDALNMLEGYGPNPALIGDQKAPSGRALTLMQQAGLAEIGPFLASYRGWKLRTYRLIWWAVKANWQRERIIRVADSDSTDGRAQQIPLNTMQNPDGSLVTDQMGRPAIMNPLARVDVDIILDDGPDTTNVMGDVFDILSTLAQNGIAVPPPILIEMSALPASTKKKVLSMWAEQAQAQPPAPPPNPADMAKVEVEKARLQLEMQKLQRDQDLEPQRMGLEADKNALAREQMVHQAGLEQMKTGVEHARLQTDLEKAKGEQGVRTTEANTAAAPAVDAFRGVAEVLAQMQATNAGIVQSLMAMAQQQQQSERALADVIARVATARTDVIRDGQGQIVGAQKRL